MEHSIMRRLISCLAIVVVLFFNMTLHAARPVESSLPVGSTRELIIPSSSNVTPVMPVNMVLDESFSETSYTAEEQEVHSLDELVKSENRYFDRIDSSAVMDLPAGIVNKNGTLDYSIIVKSMVITPDSGAFLEVVMSFEVPQNGRKIAFVGKHIPFSFKGGIVGEARIELLGDQPIVLSKDIQLILKGNGGTYASFDCEGFKSMGVKADVEFSSNIFIPEKTDGTLDKTKTLKASFQTTMYDWNDLVVELNIPPFQVKGLTGVGFNVKQAVFDFSDTHNATSMTFPAEYQSSYFSGGVSNTLWRGFYLKEATIKLPEEFKIKNSKERLIFSATNLLIDEHGLSGTFAVKNFIPLDSGDMSGWAFSIDNFSVRLLANQLTEAGFGGQMNIPVFKENSLLNYSALISTNGNYSFTASADKPIEMSMWAAKLELLPTSTVTISIKDKKFLPQANLTGSLSIVKESSGDTSSTKNNLASVASLSFEHLIIRTTRPFIEIGSISLTAGKKDKVGNFPIQINEIGFATEKERVGITFTITVNFGSDSDEGFSALGSFAVWGKRDSTSNKWKYDGIDIRRLHVETSKPGAYELVGDVLFFKNDATYGNGFNGKLKATFGSGISLSATAIFGNVNDMRYWYADGMVNLGQSGFPLSAGLSLYGFGGGVYQHMRQKGFNETAGSSLGASQSGIIYVPASDVVLGLKASVALGATKKEVINGDATFEISFTTSGGIRQIGFQGNVYMLTSTYTSEMSDVSGKAKELASGSATPSKSADAGRAQVWGTINLLFDNENSVFHGDIKMYANVAGGVMRGIGANDLAGWAVIHFAPKEWYIHIGTPTNPIGIEMARILKTKSYFMVGKNLPGSPPPPAKVSELLGNINLDYMRDLNTLESGNGLAFGASYEINTGEITFLMFYATLQAGVGFDIMLKDYGNAYCEGREGRLGINGWFANGQAYAYIEGKVGIKVDLMFYKGQYEILSVGAAAILQAKGPNPFWMKGIIGGKYSILNGVVKGSCKFEFSLGEECKVVTANPLGGIEIISGLTPAAGSTDVDVFNTPQAVFNMPLNKEFSITNEEGTTKTYRIKLDYFKVQLADKSTISGSIGWNAENDVAAYNNIDIFPSKKDITASVQVSFEEKVGSSWKTVTYKGEKVVESKQTSFVSGIAPDYIPTSNIEYAYPIMNQYNFYKSENGQGYIKLKKGQPELFTPPTGFEQKGRATCTGGVSKFNISYSNTLVTYNIPSEWSNNKVYTFDLVNIPLQTTLSIDRNVDTLVSAIDTSTTIRTKEAEGNIETLQEKSILTYHFRTSKYSTFNEKLAGLRFSDGWRRPIRINVHEIGVTLEGDEMFDKMETHWNEEIVPVVQFEAAFSETNWFNTIINPLIYNGYPLFSEIKIGWRDVTVLGVPPLKAIYIRQYPNDRMVTEDDISGTSSYGTPDVGAFVYNVAHFADQDFYDIRNKLAAYCASHTVSNTQVSSILSSMFPGVRKGDYPIDVKYVLPGTNKITSTRRVVLNNPIDDI